MTKEESKSYKVIVTAIGILQAEVIVDAISSDDAVEIAKASIKPEDFEPVSISEIEEFSVDNVEVV